jgi:filamentous hemagglutinin family protein
MFHHLCAPRVPFIGLFVLVLFVTLPVWTAADSFGQAPPITPSEGWNTQVNPISLPSNDIQYNITGGTRPGGATGTNLFHSFGEFGVPTNNIANFLNGVSFDLNGTLLEAGLPTSNILVRVSGGNVSNIFGTIQTEGFGDANLFLMNPAGFLFGPSATLNVGGMVAFTSADYLRLTDATFNAVPNTVVDALLTAMPVAAFGFLGPNAASIVVQGSTLKVAESQTLSLIGGNRTFEIATETATGDFVPSGEVSPPGVVITGGTLSAPSGHISIASVDSAGKVILPPPNEPGGLNVSSFSNLGRVELSGGTMVDVSTMVDADFNPVSTQGNGTVSIRGGQLVLNTASITALNFGTTDGAPTAVSIEVQSDMTGSSSLIATHTLDAAGGDIAITSGSLTLTESTVFAATSGVGIGGNIAISTTGSISITNSFVQAVSETDGAVGSINISAASANGSITVDEGGVIQTISGTQNGGAIMMQADQNVTIENGGMVVTSAPTSGTAGDITITAGETVTVSGLPDTLSNVIATSGGNDPTSKAGDIEITGTNFLLQNNAQIDSDALFAQPGNITITATDSVNISGGSRIRLGVRDQSGGAIDISGQNISMNSASIRTRAAGSGDAGAITLGGTTVTLTDSQITASTHDSGRGGDVTITAQENLGVNGRFTDEFGDVSPGGIFTDTQGTGAGGNISVNANTVTLQNGGTLSAKTSGTEVTATGGLITVNATNQATMIDGASVSASSTGPGNAGNITIDAGNRLDLHNSSITTEAAQASGGKIDIRAVNLVRLVNSTISTSVLDGEGGGGDIDIQVIEQLRLVNSTISTSVLGGTGSGGNIRIDPNIVVLQNSQILAQAIQGAGGNITIFTPLFLADSSSLVSASSQFGLNGRVTIQSPTSNLSGSLGPLTSKPSQAQSLLTQRCAALANGQASSFVVAGREQLPADPGGWLTSPIALAGLDTDPFNNETVAKGTSNLEPRTSSLSATDRVSLRRLTPARFLIANFADSEATGCHS